MALSPDRYLPNSEGWLVNLTPGYRERPAREGKAKRSGLRLRSLPEQRYHERRKLTRILVVLGPCCAHGIANCAGHFLGGPSQVSLLQKQKSLQHVAPNRAAVFL